MFFKRRVRKNFCAKKKLQIPDYNTIIYKFAFILVISLRSKPKFKAFR